MLRHPVGHGSLALVHGNIHESSPAGPDRSGASNAPVGPPSLHHCIAASPRWKAPGYRAKAEMKAVSSHSWAPAQFPVSTYAAPPLAEWVSAAYATKRNNCESKSKGKDDA